jgi:hypothetical protein
MIDENESWCSIFKHVEASSVGSAGVFNLQAGDERTIEAGPIALCCVSFWLHLLRTLEQRRHNPSGKSCFLDHMHAFTCQYMQMAIKAPILQDI